MDHEEQWSVEEAHAQRAFSVRFEWGLPGAHAIGKDADVAVVVDVLSFTTTVSVAIDAGMEVLPYRWKDESAVRYADQQDATLAVSRASAKPGQISLSAASIRQAEPVARLVLPSPNGSTISWHLDGMGPDVVAGCLRNAEAVARWIDNRYDRDTSTIAIVAAGERWPDGSLRPAIEDLWGAGAIISGLAARGRDRLSPEAKIAAGAFDLARGTIRAELASCASGKELIDNGFGSDVMVASELDSSDHVPVLTGSRFIRG